MKNNNDNAQNNTGIKTIFSGADLDGFTKPSDEEAEAIFSNSNTIMTLKTSNDSVGEE